MPELPEVETVVRSLRAPLVGRRVLDAWSDWDKAVRIRDGGTEQIADIATFADRLRGQTFRSIERRAKYIICQLDHDALLVHLKMTGRLYITPNDASHDADRWVHFRLQLDADQELRFSDARKFGRVILTGDVQAVTGKLGPEPLLETFTVAVLRERMQGHRKAIKALLLEQSVLAGVGNIYADEALHRSQIHPLRPSDSLSDDEVTRLHSAIQTALHAGIAREGASVNWYRKPDGTTGTAQDALLVYGRAGEPCYTCGAVIDKIRVGQRGTHFCPQCQTLT